MAKKRTSQRRAPRASAPRMYGDGKPSQAAQQQAGQPAAATAGTPAQRSRSAGAAAARPAGARGAAPVTVTQDYHYVVSDLRRLGIIAAATFGVLIVLGLIIR